MSSWVVRARRCVGPTWQEEAVMSVLEEFGVVFQRDFPVDIGGWRLFYDFRLELGGREGFLECCLSLKPGFRGVDEAVRKAAFIEFKFRSLRVARPGALGLALVEAPRADEALLRERCRLVLRSVDRAFHSLSSFESWLREEVAGRG